MGLSNIQSPKIEYCVVDTGQILTEITRVTCNGQRDGSAGQVPINYGDNFFWIFRKKLF